MVQIRITIIPSKAIANLICDFLFLNKNIVIKDTTGINMSNTERDISFSIGSFPPPAMTLLMPPKLMITELFDTSTNLIILPLRNKTEKTVVSNKYKD